MINMRHWRDVAKCSDGSPRKREEWRSVHLYGGEVNLLTSAIARMNMFLHDIEEFDVLRGDTLAEPKFIENDRLKQFDVIFANPPYSIKNGIVTSLPPIHMVVIFMVYHHRAALIMRFTPISLKA